MAESGTHPGAALERLCHEAVRDLAEGLRGDLVTPDDDSYDDARRVWNGLVNDYPALIGRCAGAADVMTAVDFAREHDVATDSTAFPWRDYNYMLTVEANWEGTDSTTHIEWARETDAAFRERGATGAYAGFPGLGDDDENVARLAYGDNYERLAALKSEYDPTNLFTETTNVPPADGR